MAFSVSPRLQPKHLFVPKGALSGENARLFAGRESVLQQTLRALDMPGTTAVVYGDRGVGKSSFGWQVFEMLQGNMEIRRRYPQIRQPDEECVCFWIECEHRYQNVPGVLLSLLRPTSGKKGVTLLDKYATLFNAGNQDQIKRAYEVNVGLAKVKIAVNPGAKKSKAAIRALDAMMRKGYEDPFELFGRMLALVKEKANQKEIIIFIDEFDRLPDHSGMGDFIKHCGDARLVIIGVAETAEELIGQHPSADRKLLGSQTEVPPLTDREIRQIFSNASDVVRRYKNYHSINFDESFLSAVVMASGGYPAIAQFLGYEAVRSSSALDRASREPVVIGLDEFNAARNVIFTGDAELNIRLRDGIGKSLKRATILDHLAQFSGGWVETSELRDHLTEASQDAFNPNVDLLVQAGVLTRSNTKVKFKTPVFRFLVLLAKDGRLLYPSKN